MMLTITASSCITLLHSAKHLTRGIHINNITSRWVFTARLHPRSKCPQLGMPVESRAQFRVPNVPRSLISERAPFRIYQHAQCRVFLMYLFAARLWLTLPQMGSSGVLWVRLSALVIAASTRCWRQRIALDGGVA